MTQTTQHTSHSIAFLGAHQPLPLVADLAVRAAVMVTKWRIRRNTRRALAQLEEPLLRDIGITPREARQQSNLWFWQP
jgi:uncharacterized protein YjiS (DUF1127 family)